MHWLRYTLAAALLCTSLGCAKHQPPRHADPNEVESDPPAPPKRPPTQEELEKARAHRTRGLALLQECPGDSALFELERAYELSHDPENLYEIALIQREQNNYVAALRSFARYLRGAGPNVPADRRTKIEGELQTLMPKVAEITIDVNLKFAKVYVDDIPVCEYSIESDCSGRSPLKEPVLVNPGRHKLTATKKGWSTATTLIAVTGADHATAKLELVTLMSGASARR